MNPKNSKQTMNWTGAAAAVLLTVTMTLTSGCVLAAAGAAGAAAAGTVAYVRGELNASLGNSYDGVVRATNRAIEQLKFAKISEKTDALTANFVARTAQDKKIEIEVIKVSENLTRVEIRVGVFGDEAVSLTILEKIKSNL